MNKSAGFTLVELLVVISIIAMLTSAILAALGDARIKARDAKRASDLRQIQNALNLYHNTYGVFPNATQFSATSGSGAAGGLVGNGFIATLPRDPVTGASYFYAALGSGTTCNNYHLGAIMELNPSVGPLTLDGDFPVAAVCTTGGTDFNGTSVACTSTAGTAAPGGTERCYDLRP